MSRRTHIIAGLLALISFIPCANASEKIPTLTLLGFLNTQFGYRDQSHAYATDENGNMFDKYGVVNDTNLTFGINANTSCFKYGGIINLNSDTSISKVGENTVGHQTMVYLESSIGRVEGGSYTGSYQAMKVSAANITRAVGGVDGDWKYWITTMVGNGRQITTPRLPTAVGSSFVANASKITYYTPTIDGFKVGITYIPDTEQHGTITNLKPLLKSYTHAVMTAGAFSANQLSGYTNVLQGGLTYDGKFDKATFKISAFGEAGKAKKFFDASSTTVVDRRDLRSWEIGVNANYMSFGFGASLGDWGKSGLKKSFTQGSTTKAVTGAKSGRYWTAGISYIYSNLGASLTCMRSRNGGFGVRPTFDAPAYDTNRARVKVLSLGIDYKLAPGFMPYAEFTPFNIQDKSSANLSAKNSGSLLLAGSKLQF